MDEYQQAVNESLEEDENPDTPAYYYHLLVGVYKRMLGVVTDPALKAAVRAEYTGTRVYMEYQDAVVVDDQYGPYFSEVEAAQVKIEAAEKVINAKCGPW